MRTIVKRSLGKLPGVRGVVAERDALLGQLRGLQDGVRGLEARFLALQEENERLTREMIRLDELTLLRAIEPSKCTVQPNEADLLRRLVEETNGTPGPIVEIGALLGVTTTNLALWKDAGRTVIAVDNFGWNPWGLTPEQHHAVTAQVLHYPIRTGQVELVAMGKNEFFEAYRGPAPSLVFLDAIHTYEETALDIAWARRVGAKVISGHDYCEQFPGVIRAVDEAGGPRHLAGSVFCL